MRSRVHRVSTMVTHPPTEIPTEGRSEIIQSKIMDIASNTSATRAPGSGSALAGFLVSGFLLALLGAILPAWGNHREWDFVAVGNYFLSLAIDRKSTRLNSSHR